jgi:hypothetical protein
MKIIVSVTTVVFALTAAAAHPAGAERVRRPHVPANLEVQAGYKAFFEGHATGTQNYICLPSASGFSWTLFGPQATLFNDDTKQVVTHFLSANPLEGGTPRATWQHSRDTSAVWAVMMDFSTDAAFVAPGAIPWFILKVVGEQDGPDGGHKLTPTAFIQRVNTAGGIPPSTGCAVSTDVGKKALVPYAADYFFYKYPASGDDE